MEVYKAVDAEKLDADLATVADAIRAKGGTTAELNFPGGFSAAVAAIKTAPTLQDKTVTPGASDHSVQADSGYDGLGTVTVKGDTNLKPENIANGVSIFGVLGELAAGSEFVIGSVSLQTTKTITITPGFKVRALLIVRNDNTMKYYGQYADGTGFYKSSLATYTMTMTTTEEKTTLTITANVAGNHVYMAIS